MSAIADFFARLTLRPDKASFDAGEKLLGTVKTAIAGLVAYKTVGFFAGMIDDVAKTAGHLDDLSKQTGVSAESLQELGFGARQSGIDMDTIAKAAGKLGVGLQSAITTGTGPAADALHALGISTASVKGKMIGPGGFDDVLNTIADSVAKMPDGFSKSNAMIGLFGKSGKELIPMMEDGSKGIDAMRARAHELGTVMSNDAVAGLAALDDSLRETEDMVKGLKQDVVVALLPTIKELLHDFADWFKANRKIIGQKIASVVRGIVFVVELLATVIGKAVDVIQFFGDNLGLLVAILGGVGGAMLILGAESVTAALESAVAWVAAAAPLILMAAIIAAVILIVQDLWTWFNGGDSVFKRLYESAKNWIGEKMMQIVNGLIRGLNRVIEAAEDVVNAINRAKNAGQSGVKGALRTLGSGDIEAQKDALEATSDARKALEEQVKSGKMSKEDAGKKYAEYLRQNLDIERGKRGIMTDEEIAGTADEVHFGRVKELATSGASGIGADVTTDPEQYDTPAAQAARAANMAARVAATAASPVAMSTLPGSSSSSSVTATANITVNAGAGADGKDIAATIRDHLGSWWDDIKRQSTPGNK